MERGFAGGKLRIPHFVRDDKQGESRLTPAGAQPFRFLKEGVPRSSPSLDFLLTSQAALPKVNGRGRGRPRHTKSNEFSLSFASSSWVISTVASGMLAGIFGQKAGPSLRSG